MMIITKSLVEYREQLHSDLPAVTGTWPTQTGGTKLRGYVQLVQEYSNFVQPAPLSRTFDCCHEEQAGAHPVYQHASPDQRRGAISSCRLTPPSWGR